MVNAHFVDHIIELEKSKSYPGRWIRQTADTIIVNEFLVTSVLPLLRHCQPLRALQKKRHHHPTHAHAPPATVPSTPLLPPPKPSPAASTRTHTGTSTNPNLHRYRHSTHPRRHHRFHVAIAATALATCRLVPQPAILLLLHYTW